MCEWTRPRSRYGYDRHRQLGVWPACDDCKTAAAAWSAEYRKFFPARVSASKRWTHFRLRESEYRALLAAQDYRCKICELPFDEIQRSDRSAVFVDHDHACQHEGKGLRSCSDCVRGLLCPGCNHFLVILEDTERLKKSLDYLQNPEAAEIIRQSRLW